MRRSAGKAAWCTLSNGGLTPYLYNTPLSSSSRLLLRCQRRAHTHTEGLRFAQPLASGRQECHLSIEMLPYFLQRRHVLADMACRHHRRQKLFALGQILASVADDILLKAPIRPLESVELLLTGQRLLSRRKLANVAPIIAHQFIHQIQIGFVRRHPTLVPTPKASMAAPCSIASATPYSSNPPLAKI